MTYQTINPATGKLLKTYEDISDAALNEVMDVAQACYENDWRRRSVAQRAGIATEGRREGMNAFLEKRAPVFSHR